MLSTISVLRVPGNFSRQSRNCTCNKKYSACDAAKFVSAFGFATYSTLLADLLQLREFMNDQIKNGAGYVFNPNRCLPVKFHGHMRTYIRVCGRVCC